MREAELRRAAAHLGVTRVELLGYRDSGFDGEAAPGSLCGAPVAEVAGALTRLVEDIDPAVVVILDGRLDEMRLVPDLAVRRPQRGAAAGVPGHR